MILFLKSRVQFEQNIFNENILLKGIIIKIHVI